MSSPAQRPDLQHQRAALEQYAQAKGIAVDQWVMEIGAGLNFERKRFLALVDAIVAGEVLCLLIAHQDRLARFGFALLKHLCETHQTEMLVNLKAYHFEEMRAFYTALIGMHHVACEYDRLDDLMKTYLRLKKIGIEPATCLNHGMTTSFYYRDPDGNYVELQVDNFGPDPAVSTAFMHTPPFLANPIGVPINPESYVAAWQQGATLPELHERSYAGEFVEGAMPPSID